MVKSFISLLKLALTHPGRLGWFVFSGFAFAAMSSSSVWLVRAAVEVLEKRTPPLWMQEHLGTESGRHAFIGVILAGAFVLVGKCLFQYLRRYLQGWLTHRIVLDVQNDLAGHLLTLDLAFFQRRRSGELLSRMTNDLSLLGVSLKLCAVIVTRPLELILTVGCVFYLNWRLAILGFVAAPIGGAIIGFLSRKMRKAAKRALEKRADLTSVLTQFLAGMRTVKAFNCEQFERDQFSVENRHLFSSLMKYERSRALTRPVVEAIAGIGTLIVLYIGGEWCFGGKIEFPDLAAFLTALMVMYNPAKELSKANNELQAALPGSERVFEILEMKSEVMQGERDLPEFGKSIMLNNVNFSYVPGLPVLRNINIEIKKGECVALVGPSGAGKSTLADLVLRFYDPVDGSVEIDGVDLRELTFASLRDKMSVVCQDPFLFNASIRDNIAYGSSDATEEKVERAAKVAGIHDEIMAMENQYDTLAGERGCNLSGGQRQRVTIARAIYKNAPILILDEATSSLDSESEKKVQEALDHLMEGRTSIVIAHRLSTIRHADRIVVIEDGKITAQGSHEELMLSSPTYSQFVRLQVVGEEKN